MNYTEALEYIHGISWCFCKPGLERIGELCRLLGNPEKGLKFIHVAGTNGKGSFCAMLASVLSHAGYKTGLYTSPYIRVFNERMQINGTPISDAELAEITSYVRPFADSMGDKPTEFELITAVAFEYFKRNHCNVIVLEAGMGGRLDSTNIIEAPLLSVITGIALDHTAFLGDTVEKIAAEKAGIIKEGRPVLFGGDSAEAEAVIRQTAELRKSEFFKVDYGALTVKATSLEGTLFDFGDRENVKLKLLGAYQPRNACSVLCAVDVLRQYGFAVDERAVLSGLEAAVWQGRFEIIKKEPLVIFDGAHNPQGIDAAVESVKQYFGTRKLLVLTGVLKDKDHRYIASRLSEIAAEAFVITPDNPRALSAEEYAAELRLFGAEATAYTSLVSAYSAAVGEAERQGIPLICLGSLYTYAELIKLI